MELPKVYKSELIYHGKIFDVVVEEIEYPSGTKGKREIVQHNGGSVVVPLLPNGNIIFVRQYRAPQKNYVLELPAGKIEPQEPPLECARRELREETGYEAETFEHLTSMMTTPGFCSEILHIYLALGLRHSVQGQTLEEGEQTIKLETYSLNEALKMVEQKEIVDGKTICGLFLTERKLRTFQS
ncbi:MAG: NUDIX hydrolase [Bacteroidetes bacterium]|nr:NUDIX hydrolase [Bacteroidota bacterium]